jgi:ribosomal protein L11 methylase PrmA
MKPDFALGGSFRDPSGRVHAYKSRIFRTISRHGAANFEAVQTTGFLDKLVARGDLVAFEKVVDPSILKLFPDAAYVLEHPRIEFISYPYEWSFPLLKAAALLQLDLIIDALSVGLTLSDASAYNVQFNGTRPVFIDHLSFTPYHEGDYWLAHRQFCEQFLNPLLLRAHLDLPHNGWYRGTLEGISTEDLDRLLPFSSKLSFRMLTNVAMPARFQRQALGKGNREGRRMSELRKLPRSAYEGVLRQLRNWVAGLQPKGSPLTVWGNYADDNTYANAEHDAKCKFIAQFVTETRPTSIVDLGCNSGAFSEVALNAGAQRALGFDFDQSALDKAYTRGRDKSLNFLALFLDAANPSPSQGWAENERSGFGARVKADAVMALAFEHHLAIGKNVPLDQVVAWITAIAPRGIIEFVPKNDPTVQAMLALREDIFPTYTVDSFEAALTSCAQIVRREQITSDGRILYQFDGTAQA